MIHPLLLSKEIYNDWHWANQLAVIEKLTQHPSSLEVEWGSGTYCIFIDKDSDFAKLSKVGDVIIYNEYKLPGALFLSNPDKKVAITLK